MAPRSSSRSWLGALTLLALGCAPEASRGDPTASVQLSLLATPRHDVRRFELRVVQGGDCSTGTVVGAETLELEEETLPPALGGGDNHPFAEELFVLEPGAYVACAAPLTASGAPSAVCAPASARVEAVAGTTAEILLVSQCVGDESGGVDVIAALNDPPVIEDVAVSPSAYLRLCESASITVTASDVDGDPLSYSWLIEDAPAGASARVLASAEEARFGTDTAGDYRLSVTVSDVHGARRSLSFPLHALDEPCNELTADWLVGAGGEARDYVTGVAVDAAGHALIHGSFLSPRIELGGALENDPSAALGWAAFVAELDSTGAVLWSRSLGADVVAGSVSMGPTGDAIVSGYLLGTVDLGCGPHTSAGAHDFFVARLSGTDGRCVWSRSFGGAEHDAASQSVVSASGDIFVAGVTWSPTLPIPGLGTLIGAGSADAFYMALAADGTPRWAHITGGPEDDEVGAIALGAGSTLLIGGSFASPVITLDSSSGISLWPNAGGRDPFVAALSASDGSAIWARAGGGTGDAHVFGVASLSGGDVVITGTFEGVLDLGVEQRGPRAPATDVFVARLGGLDGSHVWTRGGGGTSGYSSGSALGTTADGRVWLAGGSSSAIDLGNGPLLGAWVVELDASGRALRRAAGAPAALGADWAYALALDPRGALYVAGEHGASAGDAFSIGGSAALHSRGASDAWIARIRL